VSGEWEASRDSVLATKGHSQRPSAYPKSASGSAVCPCPSSVPEQNLCQPLVTARAPRCTPSQPAAAVLPLPLLRAP